MTLRHMLRSIGYKCLPLKLYLKICYQVIYNRPLHLKEPKAFSEKMYWLNLYYAQYEKNLVQLCYDKYTVRTYIKEKIGEKYLNELYGVYDKAEDIDFQKLPHQFVIKITQSSGKNLICPNKEKLNTEKTVKLLNKWLQSAKARRGQEESYLYNGNAKIVCEKFLKDENDMIPNDYRIYCFNGEPKYIICDMDTTLEDGSHGTNIRRNVYDLNWNIQDVEFGRKNDLINTINKPGNIKEMIEISRVLSKDFPFVRVDLYNIRGSLIFGELTWIPMGGNCRIKPDSFDYKLGEMLQLPNVSIDYRK